MTCRGRGPGLIASLLLAFSTPLPSSAAARRAVILKMDGVPAGLVEELIHERDPRTGKSRLPWMDEVFARNGTRIVNFYVRGISLSAPSWAMLDTGQHQIVHGNVEYDRFTLNAYDYLNFFPYYTRHPLLRVDMPGVEVLDEAGVPLIVDQFPVRNRFQSLELYQRGHRWRTLGHSVPNRFIRSPRELFDEWQTGLELTRSVDEQVERELLANLAAEQLIYLDYFSGEFDHIAHLSNDRESQRRALEKLDASIGRIWTAIRHSPLAEDTVLVLVSDHGINSDPRVYSQGYSLLDWFGGAEGGGHHAVTNRYPLTEYKIRGLNPLVSDVTSAGAGATYLKGDEQQYPTAVFDLDGNERAAVHLRNNTLNVLQILLQQMSRRDLSPQLRHACQNTFFAMLDLDRQSWQRSIDELRTELTVLRRVAQRQSANSRARQSQNENSTGTGSDAQRQAAHALDWEQERHAYGEYIRVVSNLLKLRADHFDPSQIHIDDLIPKRSMGEPNTLYDLQNYAVGLSPDGLLSLASDPGKLDLDRSLRRLNYFPALTRIRVRNNVQANVGSAPVDFVAVPLNPAAVLRALMAGGVEQQDTQLDQAIWLYLGDDSEALVLARSGPSGLLLRYVPVGKLESAPDGAIHFDVGALRAGLPLHLWEDPNLQTPGGDRDSWLNNWHSERDWFRSIHRTLYSNGLIGLTEQFTQSPGPSRLFAGAPLEDQRLLQRLEARRRRLVVPDLLIFASDHWNFNVRSFNPGGNHGSLFRISTHSVLMFAGGDRTGVRRGLAVDEPYDGLSFAPTLLRLLGRDTRALPGPSIDALGSP